MTTKEKDHVVYFLLTQMTYILLAKGPVKDGIQKAAEKHENHLRAIFTEEELKPIQTMRNTVVSLATKLVNCESQEDLQHAHDYIAALNTNEVIIAVADETATGEVTRYEPNR